MQVRIQSCATIGADRVSRVLPPHEVHVWLLNLEAESGQLQSFWALLSSEEQERANRFRVERPKSDFILTRGTLRVLLASYLGGNPENFRFKYLAQGKPRLEVEASESSLNDLQFNVSHTDGLAALAFVRRLEIGVDVEKIRSDCDADKLAERFFSEGERDVLKGLSGGSLHKSFFRCWTRKEAYIKAKGGGLSIPLHEFDVSVAENQPAMLVGTRPDSSESKRWELHDLQVPEGYAGALAVSVNAESNLLKHGPRVSEFAQSDSRR